MNIQKMSNEHKISFLDEKKSEVKDVASVEKNRKTIEQLSEEQKAKKINNKDNGLMTSKHISSAVTGIISDNKGPNKYIKGETSNSLWDNNKLQRLSSEMDNKEKTIKEKEELSQLKKIERQKINDKLVEALKQTEQSKDSTVSRMGNFEGTRYYSPKNNLSIFDSSEFERLPEKTEGEKISEDVKNKKAQKDESWKSDGKQKTFKDAMDSFFNNLIE